MIIYSDRKRRVPLLPRIAELRRRAERIGSGLDARRALLVDLGEIECALLDAERAREAGLAEAAMRAVLDGRIETAISALGQLVTCDLPGAVEVSTPEGFAYYGLYPEMYVEAATRFAELQLPQWTAVIGIRTIGATLSVVVADTLERHGSSVYRTTVRPTGHPFDRRISFDHRVRAVIADYAAQGWFAIVDEGPGLSGSSFAAVIEALLDAGAHTERIVLFPSWDPPPDTLLSESARKHWASHRRYVAPFELRHVPFVPSDSVDISAGMWRTVLLNGRQWPPVHPQHERRKYLGPDGELYKFSGIGSYGTPAYELTQQLADAGFTPRSTGFVDGFLRTPVIDAEGPESTVVTQKFLDHAARYLAFRTGLPVPDTSTDFHSLAEMIEVNCREAGVSMADLTGYEGVISDQKAVAIDGRLMTHEWLETKDGWLKLDGVDHHRDHFLPGTQDIAWDIAGLSIEFGLDAAGRDYLCERFRAYMADPSLGLRLRFFRIAYAAFRLGYAVMACASAPQEAHDFERLRRLYLQQLNSALAESR